MMRDLLSLESPERQKKETVLIDLRRFVDLLLEMKNTIVTYDHIGQPDKNAKITSASFLSDLINAPLVMPVIDSIKHIYVDEKEFTTKNIKNRIYEPNNFCGDTNKFNKIFKINY